MASVTSAKFLINDTDADLRGYQATPGETIRLRLAASPAPDVSQVVFEVRLNEHSKGAPTITIPVPATPLTEVSFVMPADAGDHTWLISATVNGGFRNGSPEPLYNFRRAISASNGVRKMAVSETTEFDPIFGWTSIFAELAGFNLSTVAYEMPLTLRGDTFMAAPAQATPLVISTAPDGHTPGSQTVIFLEANTQVGLTLPTVMQAQGDITRNIVTGVVTDFDATKRYFVLVTRLSADENVTLVRKMDVVPTAAPTVLSATISSGTPNRLVVLHSEPIIVPATPAIPDGISTPFSVGTPLNVTSVVSGNFTDTLTYGLSGSAVGTESANYVVGASRRIQSFNSAKIAAATTPITFAFGLSIPSSTFIWLDGADYSAGTGTWTDTSGHGNDHIQGTVGFRPTLITPAAINNEPAVYFDGADDFLQCSTLLESGSPLPAKTNYSIYLVARFLSAGADITPFDLETSGAGIFTGPILYRSVTNLRFACDGAANEAAIAGFNSTTWGIIKCFHIPTQRRIIHNGTPQTNVVADSCAAQVVSRLGQIVLGGNITAMEVAFFAVMGSAEQGGAFDTAFDAYATTRWGL